MESKRQNKPPRRWAGPLIRLFAGSQVLALALNPLLSLSACAQGISPGGTTNGVGSGARLESINLLSQAGVTPPIAPSQPSTILPTDVVPLPAAQERMSFGENLQLRVLQRLPARFYFNSSVESTFRYETNVFQFPTKRKLLSQIFQNTPPFIFNQLNVVQQQQIRDQFLRLSSRDDMVFRVLPNITAGWTLAPRTRFFGNFFMIRDSLFHNIRLNTVIYSLAYGIQQDIPVTRRGNLQLEFQARELYQLHQQPLFDFLPAATFSYILTPRTVLFANALLQLRGKRYFQAPTREVDPFYTFGFLHQRGGWSFSNTATLVQNFREPFRRNASIAQNNYSWILDFEIARRLIKQLPGLQAFVRAEPIYNFHSHNRPGLAGVDFRLFWGMRFALGKPALTAALEQIRQQLQEQEAPPPSGPPGKPTEPKPSAFLMPYQLIAGSPQPIHGPLSLSLTECGSSQPSVAVVPAAYRASNAPLVTDASYSRPANRDLPAPETALAQSVAAEPTTTVASGSATPAETAATTAIAPQITRDLPVQATAAVTQSLPSNNAPAQTARASVQTPVFKGPPALPAAGPVQSAGLTPHAAISLREQDKEVVKSAETNSTSPVISMIPGSGITTQPIEEVETESSAAPEEPTPVVAKPENSSSTSTATDTASLVVRQESKEETTEPAASVQSDRAPEATLRGPIQADDSIRKAKLSKKKRERKKIARNQTVVEKPAKSSGQVQMVLIPPLPPVNLKSKDKPFGDSGIEASRPVMMNLVH